MTLLNTIETQCFGTDGVLGLKRNPCSGQKPSTTYDLDSVPNYTLLGASWLVRPDEAGWPGLALPGLGLAMRSQPQPGLPGVEDYSCGAQETSPGAPKTPPKLSGCPQVPQAPQITTGFSEIGSGLEPGNRTRAWPETGNQNTGIAKRAEQVQTRVRNEKPETRIQAGAGQSHEHLAGNWNPEIEERAEPET